jgi:mannosyltransferase
MKLDTKLFNNSNFWLSIIIIIGSILRFLAIDNQSVWLDEIHTLNEANPDFNLNEVYNSVYKTEQMPVLYFIIINFLFKIFGYTSIVLRSFSAICGVISIYSTFLLSKEFFNKKVGLISALLISVNYFAIYYSQEGRPYSFLYLFTTLSFFYLIKFIKKTTLKNSILFGFFTALMLYGHFFALFTLISQILILLLFFILIDKEIKRNYFKLLFISATIIFLLHIPSLKILLNISKIQSFWVETPSKQIFNIIFNEFFGESELLLFLVEILFIMYFISVFREKQNDFSFKKIIANKKIFSFIILFFWIVITLIIPLIRSYLKVPMLVNRYFMVLLPAIILIISYGFYQIKSKIIFFSVLIIFIVFSITDLFIIKKYYKNITKSQFREVSLFINDNNDNNDIIVSSLSWYFPYFFTTNELKPTFVNSDLDTFVQHIKSDSTKCKTFWYVNAHGRNYNPSQSTIDYLEKHFYVDKNFDGYDAWVKKYEPLKNKLKLDLSKLKFKGEESIIKSNIEVFEKKDNYFLLSGWSIIKGLDSSTNKLELFLISPSDTILVQKEKTTRKDITSFFKEDNIDYDSSGFQAKINLDNIPNGVYKIAIYIKNSKEKIEEIKTLDLSINN